MRCAAEPLAADKIEFQESSGPPPNALQEKSSSGWIFLAEELRSLSEDGFPGGSHHAPKISLIFSASLKSYSLRPFTLCVFRSITTLFHTLNHSGWWFMASATSATRVMLPNAATKSLHANSRCSLPFSTLHPLALGSSAVISGSDSFFAGISPPSGVGWHPAKPLCGAGLGTATIPALRTRSSGCLNPWMVLR